MRTLAWTVIAIAMTSAAVPAHAQTYDPNYPVCIQVYQRGANYISCGFTSIAQCQLSASGRAAQCLVNPFYAGAYQPYPAPAHRHRRHHVS